MGETRRAPRLHSGTFSRHTRMAELDPRFVQIDGPPVAIPAGVGRVVRVASPAIYEAALTDRRVIGAVVHAGTYEDAELHRHEAQRALRRAPCLYLLGDASASTSDRAHLSGAFAYPASDTEHAVAHLTHIVEVFRQSYDAIQHYGRDMCLSEMEMDHLWQMRRGVADDEIPRAQGVKYSTKAGRLKSLREKTGRDRPADMLADAEGLWRQLIRSA